MLKKILLWTVAVFVLLQFIQITILDVPKGLDKNSELKVSHTIDSILRTSCYDCHSYETKVPWYGNIAPASWEVRGNINKGREWLNFQEWGSYSEEKKQKIYRGIAKSINMRMPLPMYLTLHEEAELSKDERKLIKEWAKSKIIEEE